MRGEAVRSVAFEYRGAVVVLDDGAEAFTDLIERVEGIFPTVHRMTADTMPDAHENIVPVGRKHLNVKTTIQQMYDQGAHWALIPSNRDSVEVIADFVSAARPLLAKGFPAFVLISGRTGRRYNRVAMVADTASPITTGSLTLAAVGVAWRTNATLDVLILGGDPAHPPETPEEVRALFNIREEAVLLDEAVSQAHELGLTIRWIPLGSSTSLDQVVLDAVRDADYDLVLDDLRAIDVGPRFGRVKRVRKQLFEGDRVDTAYRLLRDAPSDVAIVVDAVRMQLVPASYLRAGAVAALSLGVIGVATAPVAANAAAPVDSVAIEAPVDPTAEAATTTMEDATPEGVLPVGTPAPDVETLPEELTEEEVAELESAREAEEDALEAEQQELEALEEQSQTAEQQLTAAESAVASQQQRVDYAETVVDQAEAEYNEAVESNQIGHEEEMLRLGDLNKAEKNLAEAEASLAEAEANLAQVETATAPAIEAAETQQDVVEAQAENVAEWNEVLGAAEERAPQVVSPVPDHDITTHYGVAGENWASGHHTGTDFAADIGTEVQSVADGEVIFAGVNGPYGNQVAVEHEDGTVTTYSHLDEIHVDVGDEVDAGDQIGTVGSTGNSTGPHLHFEVHDEDGTTLDSDHWLEENVTE